MTWRDWYRERRYAISDGWLKGFGWFVLGSWVASSFGYSQRDGLASFVGISALYAALLWWLYSAGNKYRTEHKLTWLQFSGRAISFLLAWGVLVELAHWFQADSNRVSAVLLIIGFCVAYVAGGLLVLYLAVRVVRAAWYRGQPLE
jgi:peptidoglycan biosynthesis protein MviN/MurJ (putative lipid II flippase)